MNHNAHVIDYLFWEFKKDKTWYWFPLKQEHIKPLIRIDVA